MAVVREITLASEPGARSDTEKGSLFFVGTATVILRYAGFAILTDPNFLHAGDHAHIGYGLTATRLTNPALEIEDLPPLDFCVLSHYHGDHFDQIVEQKLRKDLPIVTTQHASGEIGRRGFVAPLALGTWQSIAFVKGGSRVLVTSLPGRHGPALVEKFLPTVMGSMLEFQTGDKTTMRLYITGDTLLFDDIRQIPERYPEIDLAVIHLGGARIMGILLTMDADEGVGLIRLVRPREAVPVHYNDYEVFKSPLLEFKKAVDAAGLSDRVRYLSHGETYEFRVPEGRIPKAA